MKYEINKLKLCSHCTSHQDIGESYELKLLQITPQSQTYWLYEP